MPVAYPGAKMWSGGLYDPGVPKAGNSEWELLLKELGLSEDDKAAIVRNEEVREFVVKKCHSRYVPLWLLEYFGMESVVYYSDPYMRAFL